MNGSWITLRDIEYLLAVAKFGHFAKAAEACHVSQPALSTQIRKFEERLGVPIFERDNRSVRITEAGQEILAQARKLAEEASRLVEGAHVPKAPLSGPFRLGAIATVGPYLLPKILSPFKRNYPKCRLFLKEGLTDELLEELESGELDAVIAADTFAKEHLVKTPLYFERFLAAVPKGHPLEQKRVLSTREIDAREMVLLEDGHCLSDQVLELCPKGKGVRRESFQTTSLETLRHLVASGAGYTLIPEMAIQKGHSLEELITYLPFEKQVGREIVLVTRKTFTRHQDVKALAQLIHEILPAK
ncbi:LysR family transcriptional regulator [bacterium]|nr:LysR family transcriptional regulator [bacterium]